MNESNNFFDYNWVVLLTTNYFNTRLHARDIDNSNGK